LETHQEQLLNYSFREGVKLSILTNGFTWWFYLPLNEGSWEERRFFTADFFEQDPKAISERFVELLSKEHIASGVAIRNAENLYKSRQKKNILKEAIPRAWHKIINEPDDLFVELLIEKKVTAIGFEAIEDQAGNLIILTVMSEIAGKLAVPLAAHYLQARQGGKGILLGGIPGVPPSVVVVLGAGVVGSNAAILASQMGAQVMVLDKDVSRLRALEEKTQFRIASAVATPYNICRFVPIADVLIGAVFIQMESTPHILDEELIRKMRPHSVFMDISIDQGGCSTTSRPTTIIEPVYLKEGVIHFCVPNIPALVPRTATIALSNILLPFLEQMAEKGPQKILSSQKSFARGFYTYNGFCLKEKIADHLGLPFVEMKT